MMDESTIETGHLLGDQPLVVPGHRRDVVLDSYAGRVHVEWDADTAVTPLGQLPFFIDYLKTSGLFDGWVGDSPLYYRSPNAPQKRDILGTVLLSILSGHWRYAHMATLRGDAVLPELLGMERIMSEDAVRRSMAAIEESAGIRWLQHHLEYCTQPTLGEPWVLDVDTTV